MCREQGSAVDDHTELVSADPAHERPFRITDGSSQRLGRVHEEAIAFLVAECVVHDL